MPQPLLLQRLDDLRRRIRGLLVLDGLGRVTAAAVLLTLAAVSADYLLRFPGAVRLALLIGVAAAWGRVALQRLVRPIAVPLTPRDLALRVERAFPAFGDRFSNAVAFLTERQDSPDGSRMANTVVAEADRIVARNNLSRALRPKRALAGFGAGVLAAGVAAAIYLADEDLVATGLARLYAPLSDAQWPTWVKIDPATLPAGADRRRTETVGRQFEWEIALLRGDARSLRPRAWLNHNVADPAAGGWFAVDLVRVRPDEPRFRLAHKVGKPFVYWFEAGDDRCGEGAPYRVDAVPRITAPAIGDIAVEIRPPEYTALPPSTADLREGPATAVAGSTGRVRLRPAGEVGTSADGSPAAALFVTEARAGGGSASTRRPLRWGTDEAGRRVLQADLTFDGNAEFWVWLAGPAGHENCRPEQVPAADGATGMVWTAKPSPDAVGPEERFTLRAVPDALPRVRFEQPERRDTEVLAGASVPMRLLAEDDYGFRDRHGIGQVRLRARLVPASPGEETMRGRSLDINVLSAFAAGVEQTRIGPGRVELRARWTWELAPLKVMPGDVIEYVAAVRDSAWRTAADGKRVPLHPEPEYSDSLTDRTGKRTPGGRRLRVLSHEDFAALMRRDFQEIQRSLVHAGVEQRNLQRQLEPAAAKLAEKKSPGLDGADRAQLAELEGAETGLAGKVEAAREGVEKLRRRMEWNNFGDEKGKALAREVAEALGRVAKRDLPKVNDALRAAREAPPADKPAQARAVDDAAAAQAAAARNLKAIADRMREWSGLSQLQGRLMELSGAHRQVGNDTAKRAADPETQGKAPEELPAGEREKNNRLAERQGELAKEVEKLAGDLERFADEVEKQDRDSAERARAAADVARKEDIRGKMEQAAKSISGNRSGNAAGDQEAAQDALDRLQDRLDGKKDGRDLDALVKKFAGALEAVNNLIRRQERHIADVKTKGKDAKPPSQIALEQDQTRRNAEAVAEEIRAIPDSGEAEPEVGRAAVRMRRAARLLAGEETAEALVDQDKALAHLKQARKILAELAAKKRKERQDRQAAKVAGELAKIRDAQEGLRKQNLEIAKRLGGGAVGRRDLAKVAEMAKQQEALRGEAAGVKEQLKKTVVYQWVLEEVVGLMDAAGKGLAERKVGDPTAGPQGEAVAKLDQLIESLKPDERERFVDVASGGGEGGGGGGPVRPVPPVAELKVLRGLQLDLNKRVRLFDDKYSDKPVLDAGDAAAIRTLSKMQETIHRMAGEMAEELQKR